jgi:hypothetical protein
MADVTPTQFMADVQKFATDAQAAWAKLQAAIAAGPPVSPAVQSAMNAMDATIQSDDALANQIITPPAARKS